MPSNPLDRDGPHSELLETSLAELAARIRSREVSSIELVDAYLERIAAYDGRRGLNAYITVPADSSRAEARRMDDRLADGVVLGPLHGVPIAVKDNLDTAGLPTTAGSSVLQNNIASSDSTVVSRLKAAGAIVLGKTNMHEFAFGITNNNPHYGPCRNPYDHTRIPGGSSGGSAAAVTAGLCAGALGTDTGGSIRIPAALCGCVGFKPTNGRVSRGGLIYLSFTFDCIGPITRTVEDAALLLSVLSGIDDHDRESREPPPQDAPDGPLSGWAGVRLGVPRAHFYDDLDPAVAHVMSGALTRLKEAGAQLIDTEIIGVERIVEPGYAIVLPEAVHLLGSYLENLENPISWAEALVQMSPTVRRVFGDQLAGKTEASYTGQAYLDSVRNFLFRFRRTVLSALEDVDALVVPTTPLPAAPIGDDDETMLNGRKVETFQTFFRNTFFANFAGLPAISLVAGETDSRLPISIQFVGRPWQDSELLRLAALWEASQPLTVPFLERT